MWPPTPTPSLKSCPLRYNFKKYGSTRETKQINSHIQIVMWRNNPVTHYSCCYVTFLSTGWSVTLRKAAPSTAGAFYEKWENFSDELSYAFNSVRYSAGTERLGRWSNWCHEHSVAVFWLQGQRSYNFDRKCTEDSKTNRHLFVSVTLSVHITWHYHVTWRHITSPLNIL